ncbi:unnamed protein product [Kuraishia capsulata CBS 1993]|uniref:Ribosomal protein L35Ae n=1 Tax=Kuraishia capsulata CBS 1993 TaxID=1382522 RepID=W6MJN9_9ASCO|nr:uncharacterized protein KUCA_T00002733001 [Kuraishia capsulata CBS 1993]CDK26759.1 unnamed protein product [Kuraishia capsulata CBS 1993]
MFSILDETTRAKIIEIDFTKTKGLKTNFIFTVYVKGKHVSYQRSKNVTNPNVSLIKIEGVATPEDAKFYLGKRIAYVYRASKEIRGSKIRVIWGKVARTHGNNGLVRATFKTNLPAKTFGASVRIMLYPSNI